MLLCEGLEILALLGSFFNSQIQFDMVRLGNLFIFGFQFMLTRNLVVYILTPFHKISGATEKKVANLSWHVTAWELAWLLSAAIGGNVVDHFHEGYNGDLLHFD